MPIPTFYDRVAVYLNNIAYLPDGIVRNFTMDVSYNSTINQGFSPTGLASGVTYGNKTIANVNWTEYLQPLDQYINLSTLLKANPNTLMTIVPISIATGVPNAPQFTMTGIVMKGMNITAAEEGSPMIRTCTFMAVDASNT